MFRSRKLSGTNLKSSDSTRSERNSTTTLSARSSSVKLHCTRSRRRAFLQALLGAALAVSSLIGGNAVQAQTDLYWDANGNTSGTGGSGAWNTSSLFWRSGSSSGTLGAWSNGNNAFFGGTAGTATIASGGVSLANMTFSTTGFRVTGSPLTLTGTPTISVTTGSSTIGTNGGTAVLAGTAGFTLNGGGELILAAGLQSSLSGGVKVTGESILTAGDRNLTTVNVSGGSGVSGFFGGNALNLDNGTLRIAASSTANSALSGLGTITVTNTGTVNIWRTASSASMSPSLTSSNVIMNAGSVLAVTTGGNTSGSPTITFGNLSANGSFSVRGQAGTVTAAARFGTINDGGFAMTILGGGSGTVQGVQSINSLATSGNSLSGSLVIGDTGGTQGAVYAATSVNQLTSGSITVNPYSQLLINSPLAGGSTTYGTAAQTITLSGIGNQTLAGVGNSGALRFDVVNGTQTAAYSTTLQSSIVLAADSVVSVAGGSGFSNTATLSGGVSGSGGLQKQGAGTLILSGTSTYAGATTISNGAITVAATGSLGTGSLSLAQTSTNNTALTLNNSSQTTGSLSSSFAATTGTQSQVITLNGTALTVNQTTDGIFGTGAVSTLTSTITGTGSLTKAGSAILTLTGANTYTGGTTINNGTVTVSGSGTLGGSAGALAVNATDGITSALNLNVNQTVNGLSGTISGTGTATITIGNGSTLTTNQNTNTQFDGIIAGAGALNKTGTGTLTLGGVNTYTGATNVTAGKLVVNGNNSAATGTLTVGSSATLGGSGTLGGATIINGEHSPGNSPGLQTFAGGLTYNTGSSLTWELIEDTLGVRGTHFDGIDVTGGTLTINPGVTSNLVFNGAGSLVNWGDSFWNVDRQWLVFDNANAPSLGSIFGTINVSADGASNSFASIRAGASFSWSQSGNDLFLNYHSITAVPEPSSLALIGVVFASAAFVRRRKLSV